MSKAGREATFGPGTPSIGRIVQYAYVGGKIRPAIVTDIDIHGLLSLTVFLAPVDVTIETDDGIGVFSTRDCFLARSNVAQNPDGESFVEGTWRWPPRV